MEPPNPLTLHSQAQALFNLKQYKAASDKVDACIAERSDYPGCLMLKANVLNKLGQTEEAKAIYLKALKLAGQKPPSAPRPRPPGAQANPPR